MFKKNNQRFKLQYNKYNTIQYNTIQRLGCLLLFYGLLLSSCRGAKTGYQEVPVHNQVQLQGNFLSSSSKTIKKLAIVGLPLMGFVNPEVSLRTDVTHLALPAINNSCSPQAPFNQITAVDKHGLLINGLAYPTLHPKIFQDYFSDDVSDITQFCKDNLAFQKRYDEIKEQEKKYSASQKQFYNDSIQKYNHLKQQVTQDEKENLEKILKARQKNMLKLSNEILLQKLVLRQKAKGVWKKKGKYFGNNGVMREMLLLIGDHIPSVVALYQDQFLTDNQRKLIKNFMDKHKHRGVFERVLMDEKDKNFNSKINKVKEKEKQEKNITLSQNELELSWIQDEINKESMDQEENLSEILDLITEEYIKGVESMEYHGLKFWGDAQMLLWLKKYKTCDNDNTNDKDCLVHSNNHWDYKDKDGKEVKVLGDGHCFFKCLVGIDNGYSQDKWQTNQDDEFSESLEEVEKMRKTVAECLREKKAEVKNYLKGEIKKFNNPLSTSLMSEIEAILKVLSEEKVEGENDSSTKEKNNFAEMENFFNEKNIEKNDRKELLKCFKEIKQNDIQKYCQGQKRKKKISYKKGEQNFFKTYFEALTKTSFKQCKDIAEKLHNFDIDGYCKYLEESEKKKEKKVKQQKIKIINLNRDKKGDTKEETLINILGNTDKKIQEKHFEGGYFSNFLSLLNYRTDFQNTNLTPYRGSEVSCFANEYIKKLGNNLKNITYNNKKKFLIEEGKKTNGNIIFEVVGYQSCPEFKDSALAEEINFFYKGKDEKIKEMLEEQGETYYRLKYSHQEIVDAGLLAPYCDGDKYPFAIANAINVVEGKTLYPIKKNRPRNELNKNINQTTFVKNFGNTALGEGFYEELDNLSKNMSIRQSYDWISLYLTKGSDIKKKLVLCSMIQNAENIDGCKPSDLQLPSLDETVRLIKQKT